MGSPSEGQPFLILFALVAATLLLVALGFVLRRRGMLASRGAAFLWAVLTIVPLFGAGALMFGKHVVEMATGETKPGVNVPPTRERE